MVNQQIAGTDFTQPQEIVTYMGAMQAQEYAAARWAVGLRLPSITDAEVENALDNGSILRTHVLRPTWHLVAPADIRWMLRLTAPRVHAANAYSYRQQGLDAKIFKRSTDAIAKALEGGKHLTRTELVAVLEHVKIPASSIKLACIMMYAELERVICSGPRAGKQFTYALIDERAPMPEDKFDRPEAIAALALRYFESRWPATAKDFTWWSGLTATDVKEGIAMLPPDFKTKLIDGQEFILKDADAPTLMLRNTTFLLPNFDEYGISYKDRSIIKSGEDTHHLITKNGGSVPSLVINGQIAGTWKTSTKKGIITVETATYQPLTKTKQHAVEHAVKRYCDFVNNR